MKNGKSDALIKSVEQKPESGDVTLAHGAHEAPDVPEAPKAPPVKPESSEAYLKVAKFLAILGRDEAAVVLAHFEPAETDRILNALAHLEPVPPAEARRLLVEFGAGARTMNRSSVGGPEVARDILIRAMGTEKGERAFYRILPDQKRGFFDYLSRLSTHQLHALIVEESEMVVALIVAHAARDIAAQILSGLDGDKNADVVRRIAKMEKVDESVIRAVESGLHKRLEAASVPGTEEIDGPGRLADILRHMDLSQEEEILNSLTEESDELTEKVKNRLTTLDDLLRIPDKDMQVFLQRIDDTDLAIFLKGKRVDLQDKIRTNVSSRRWEMIEMNRESLGPMKKRDVDRVGSDLLVMIRRMVQDGEISMLLPGEEYV